MTINIDANSLDEFKEKFVPFLTKGIVGEKGYGICYHYTPGSIVWVWSNDGGDGWFKTADTNTTGIKRQQKTASNETISARTDYKVVQLLQDVWLWFKPDHLNVTTDVASHSGNSTLLPRHQFTRNASGGIAMLNFNRVVVPNWVNTTDLQNYFNGLTRDMIVNSSGWFYRKMLPPTLPIYFNDFYHIRTPLYKDGL